MLNKTVAWLSIGAVTLALGLGQARANEGSLFPLEDGEALVGDRSAIGIGDIVTILINERASATDASTSRTNRNSESGVKQDTGGLKILGDIFGKLGLNTDSSNEAGGATTHTGVLTAQISARVIDELPNGNLLVEGRREIAINNESQLIKLTGIIRQRDVNPDNTISSALISDAKISYYGKGPIAEKHKPGILQKVFDVIF